MTQKEIATLNAGLRGKAPGAHINTHGQLWVRSRGWGETPADLAEQMSQAEAYLLTKGYQRDRSEPIFRDGHNFGQALRRTHWAGA